jgi:hypothetical protein
MPDFAKNCKGCSLLLVLGDAIKGWKRSRFLMFFTDKDLLARSAFLGLLLLSPFALFAQRGPGGHVGGGTAGGTGMGSNGSPTGLDIKDDLRGFHDVLAVQATKEQAAAYAAMMKTTSVADTDLTALEAQLRKANESNPSATAALASFDKQSQDDLGGALSLSKKFLESFSEPQKTGLKEISKRLARVDSELAQEINALDLPAGTGSSGNQILASVQNLHHALTNFQRAELDLGEEMSIPAASNGQGFTYNLAPAKNAVNIGGQAMTVTTSGTISKTTSEKSDNTFAVELSDDLSDVQFDITDILRSHLDTSDRCGERVDIQTAELTPRNPAAVVVAQLHFERWTCSPIFGQGGMNEIVEGNGTIEIQLTPAVAPDGTMKLAAQIGQVQAQDLIGDLLRSGSLGQTIRDKTAQAFVSIMRQSTDFKNALPSGVRNYAVLRHAEFQGTGAGRLVVRLNGEINVPNEQLSVVTSELQHATQEPVPGPLLTRPATPQQTVER